MATTAQKAAPGLTDAAPAPAAKKPAAKKAAAKRPAAKKPASKPAAKPTSTSASKSASKSAAKPATKPAATRQPKAAPAKAEKPKKPKLVRDSFTMPEDEYALLAKIKKNCVAAGVEVKKSELLRIGVSLLAGMDPKKLQAAQKSLPELKAGRPKKQK